MGPLSPTNVGKAEHAHNEQPVPSGHLSLVEDIRTDFDRLRGRLYELVECTGMPDTQAEAFKRLIRKQSGDIQSRVERRLLHREDVT